jgi:hypothetical protein
MNEAKHVIDSWDSCEEYSKGLDRENIYLTSVKVEWCQVCLI